VRHNMHWLDVGASRFVDLSRHAWGAGWADVGAVGGKKAPRGRCMTGFASTEYSSRVPFWDQDTAGGGASLPVHIAARILGCLRKSGSNLAALGLNSGGEEKDVRAVNGSMA